MSRRPHRTAVCLVSLEVQGGRAHVRVTLDRDLPGRSAGPEQLTFADVDTALAAVREFAERWWDDARGPAFPGDP